MLCDLCSKNEAAVHLTEIIDNQTRELHLCESCAREKGSQAAQDFGLGELLAGLASFGPQVEDVTKAKPACPQCGLTYDDFRRTGRLGCGRCYETFHRFLMPLLKRIHGSTQHTGRIPAASKSKALDVKQELAQLKEQLKTAVASESFEEAARLRDRIRAIEGKARRNTGGKSK